MLIRVLVFIAYTYIWHIVAVYTIIVAICMILHQDFSLTVVTIKSTVPLYPAFCPWSIACAKVAFAARCPFAESHR